MSTQAVSANQIQTLLSAFTATGIGTWEFDPTSNQAFWSSHSREMFGLFSERLISYADWAAAVHPDDFARAEKGVYVALKETGIYDEEYRTIGIEDGKLRWVRSIAKVEYDSHGKPTKMAGILIETTQSKIREVVEESSDARIKLIADTMPQLVWTTAPDGYHDFYNRRWYEYTGLTYEQTKGVGWNAVLHPDDLQRTQEVWAKSLQTGADYEIEYRIRRHDGVYRWFLGRALPLRDEKGKITKWFGTCTDIHDQKEVEQKLAESERRFRTLAQNTPALITRHDRDFKHLYISPTVERLTGLKPEDLIGKGYREVGFDETLCRFWDEHLTLVFTTRQPHQTEYSVKINDDDVYFLSQLEPEFNEHGEIESVLVISTDITQLKKTELAMRENEKRFRSLAENSPDLITRHGRDHRYLYVNSKIEGLTGIPPEAFIGKSYYELPIPEELCPIFDEHLSRVFKSGKPHEMEYTAFADTEVNIFSRLVPEFNPHGEIESVLVISTDVTEQKKVERAIRESELQFRTLANSIPQLAWMANADGWVHWFNERWYEFTGTSPEQVQGWGWQKVHHPDHVERVAGFAKQSFAGTEPVEITFPLRRYDGTYRWFLTRVFPLKSTDGKVQQWLGTSTDITDQKEAADLLEQKVAERTAELELRNRELEQFTYVSHHDLQEPLRKIIMFSDMVQKESDKLSVTAQNRLERVISAARRMSTALRDVLDYASLDKKEQFGPVDLNEVLAGVQTDLELFITEKNAHIVSAALPVIRAVPHQMQQLFYNLLNNALKFARPGVPPQVIITCQRLQPEALAAHPDLPSQQAYFEIAIADNGIGFQPDYSEKIFGLFQRLHNKEAYPGSGIGLALCKKVVANHGGKIWASSNAGEGAVFHVLLPDAPKA